MIGTINSSSNFFNLLIVSLLTTNCACSYSSHQQELDMIPLMMQKDYSPKGWLGMILGTRMWYAMYSAVCPPLS
jgi:hypothetical protein